MTNNLQIYFLLLVICPTFDILRLIGAAVSGSNGHCIALNNIGNYLTSNSQIERSKLLIDFPNNENSNIISSEGCFACDMNKVNKRANRRVVGSRNGDERRGRRGRRLRNRANVHGRKRRHKRNNQDLPSPENGSMYVKSTRKKRRKPYSGRHYRQLKVSQYNTQSHNNVSLGIENTTIDNFHAISLKRSKSTVELHSTSKKLGSSIPNSIILSHKHSVERLAITLSREATRNNRYDFFFCIITLEYID